MSQYEDYMSDLSLVKENGKPAVIIERRKSAKAYLMGLQAAYSGSAYAMLDLKDSSGQRHRAVIIGFDDRSVRDIMVLLRDRGLYNRKLFQIKIGMLLGYTLDDCMEFVRSSLSLTCGCQLCGGPTPESFLDDQATAARMINRGGS